MHFPTPDGLVKSVQGVDFRLEKGRTLCIVGESGSGKSVTSLAVMGLHDKTGAQVSGEVLLDGRDVLAMDGDELRRIRGNRVALISQDTLSALHPYYTIGDQIVEAIRCHRRVSRAAARGTALKMLDRVGIAGAERRIDQYPHEFSGGMRQRAMIAMALINHPDVLIADEPTTALDVTVQAQILDLLHELQQEFGMAIIMVTHDLGVAAQIADDVLVMYAGSPVEYAPALKIFTAPEHPYTWGLLTSMPRSDRPRTERLTPINGLPPSLIDLPPACAFNPRCAFRDRVPGDRCRTVHPELRLSAPDHAVRCFLTDEERPTIFVNEILPLLKGPDS